MTPPVPDPPVGYTYSSKDAYTDGPYTGYLYGSIQDSNGDACSILIRREGQSSDEQLSRLAVTEVTAFDQVNRYFSNSFKTVAILADNATVGGTHPYYSYNAGTGWVQAGTAEVKSSTPEDYFSDIKSGNFTLEQRS